MRIGFRAVQGLRLRRKATMRVEYEGDKCEKKVLGIFGLLFFLLLLYYSTIRLRTIAPGRSGVL